FWHSSVAPMHSSRVQAMPSLHVGTSDATQRPSTHASPPLQKMPSSGQPSSRSQSPPPSPGSPPSIEPPPSRGRLPLLLAHPASKRRPTIQETACRRIVELSGETVQASIPAPASTYEAVMRLLSRR